MSAFSLKQRIGFFFWLIFFSFFMIGIIYLGIESVCEYLSFPSVLTYSTGAVALIFLPVSIVPILLLSVSPIFKGKKSADTFAVKMSKTAMYGIVMVICVSFTFKFIYLNKLKDKGYVQCKGIPTGWMPGMATKYVTDESLCHKNR